MLAARPLLQVPRGSRLRGLAGVLVGGLTIAVAIFFALTLAFDFEPSTAAPIAVLLGLTSERFVELALNWKRDDLFAPTTLIASYFALDFAIRAIYLLKATDPLRIGFVPYEDYIPTALWCASLGYLAFTFGFRSQLAQGLVRKLPKALEWPQRLPFIRLTVLLLVGVACSAYLFSIGASVGTGSSLEFVYDPVPGTPVLLKSLVDMAWIALCVALFRQERDPGRMAAWPLLICSVVAIGFDVVITGSKEAFLAPLIEAVIILYYFRKLRVWHLLAVALPSLVLAFGVINAYRFIAVGKVGRAPKTFQDIVELLSVTSDYFTSGSSKSDRSALDQMLDRQEGVDALATIIKFTPEAHPYMFGRELLMLPVQTFIPRSLWKDKPVENSSMEFEQDYLGAHYDYNGFTSIHLIADCYRNFWYVGVACGMFLLGLFLRSVYLFCSPRGGAALGVFLYAYLVTNLTHYMELFAFALVGELIRQVLLLFAVCIFLGVHRKWHNDGISSIVPLTNNGRRLDSFPASLSV